VLIAVTATGDAHSRGRDHEDRAGGRACNAGVLVASER
jgi:hypothetical protein